MNSEHPGILPGATSQASLDRLRRLSFDGWAELPDTRIGEEANKEMGAQSLARCRGSAGCPRGCG